MTLVKQFKEAKKFKDFYTFSKIIESSETKLTHRKISNMLKASSEYASLGKGEKQKYFNSLVFISLGKFKI